MVSNATSIVLTGPQDRSSSSKLAVSAQALSAVLAGVAVATKASPQTIQPVSTWLEHMIERQKVLFTDEWELEESSRDSVDIENGFREIFSLTLAIALLREHTRQGVALTSQQLDYIWSMISTVIRTRGSSDMVFVATRSAQGFLVVPLCSLVDGGRIQELWRFHCWLPDEQRGLSGVTIHAHQPFGQSWVLAGSGTDVVVEARIARDGEVATHAAYDCCYMDTKGTSTGYKTHQLSSTISNTGKLRRAVEVSQQTHTRNMTYNVPAGVYHQSIVLGNQIHATLFVFDASRGFEQDSFVLGPVDGEQFTQVRDAAGITALCLVEIADALREFEEQAQKISEREKTEVMHAYYRYFMLLHSNKKRDIATLREFLGLHQGTTPMHIFARYPSPRHRVYLSNAIKLGADFDLIDSNACKILDYCVANKDTETESILMEGLRWNLDSGQVQKHIHEATVRTTHRKLYETLIRPRLLDRSTDAFPIMRNLYARALAEDAVVRQNFDGLRFAWYEDFNKFPRMPRYSDGIAHSIQAEDKQCSQPQHIIYIAYRWLYKNPFNGKTANDDSEHTQYRRMLHALAHFLKLHPEIEESTLGIWLDSVCVDRQRPLPGIAALPLNLAQCNTLLTIEDDAFWDRAWCSVEAYVFQKLRRSYHRHHWYRYKKEEASQADQWELVSAPECLEIDMSSKSMTWERDRDVIVFLERQAAAF